MSSPFTYTFISHWMAGVHVIWFSVPVTCICANVMALQHFLTIFSQCAHVFCILQWSVHVVYNKPTDKLDLVLSLNVWRPCKWCTFYCYVVMSCILTTVRQFSITSSQHWNVSYTLIKMHVWYIIDQQSVRVYFYHLLNCRRASYLIFSASYMHLYKCNDSAAFFHHFLPICTRFLYTIVECACGTLQINKQINSNCLTKRMATVQVIHILLLCCHVLHPNNCAAVLNHIRSTLKRQLYTDKDSMCGAL